jgi:hypothetical protein
MSHFSMIKKYKSLGNDPMFDEHIGKRVVIVMRKIEKHENPFEIEKYITVKTSMSMADIDGSEYIHERQNQIRIDGVLVSVTNPTEDNIRTVTLHIEDGTDRVHIITNDLPCFAMYVDNTNMLHARRDEAFALIKINKKLNSDILNYTNKFLSYDHKQVL